ncbi:MAG: FeoA family protein [Thermodesulfobacteriota bacterium]|nr:FeoA family protein [Thermodesulfobacteriota bacterium]
MHNTQQYITCQDLTPNFIYRYQKGRGIRSKLHSAALDPDVYLRVVNRNGPWPVMAAMKDSRLAIGHGMAEKILVE